MNPEICEAEKDRIITVNPEICEVEKDRIITVNLEKCKVEEDRIITVNPDKCEGENDLIITVNPEKCEGEKDRIITVNPEKCEVEKDRITKTPDVNVSKQKLRLHVNMCWCEPQCEKTHALACNPATTQLQHTASRCCVLLPMARCTYVACCCLWHVAPVLRAAACGTLYLCCELLPVARCTCVACSCHNTGWNKPTHWGLGGGRAGARVHVGD